MASPPVPRCHELQHPMMLIHQFRENLRLDFHLLRIRGGIELRGQFFKFRVLGIGPGQHLIVSGLRPFVMRDVVAALLGRVIVLSESRERKTHSAEQNQRKPSCCKFVP